MRFPLAFIGGLAMIVRAAVAADPSPRELPPQPGFPDPLVALDGTRVATRGEWESRRRPELRALFEQYMYGRYPEPTGKTSGSVDSKVLFEDPAVLDGAGTLREIELTIGPPGWPKIYLLMATPNGKTPAACFVGMNFGGNHLLTDDRRVRIPQAWVYDDYPGVVNDHATEAGRGAQPNVWPLAEIVGRGYAVATFYCGDVQPDRPFEREGMRVTLSTVEGKPDPAETATIMWWAWGLHRAVDYLSNDKLIDPQRIAVVGHSRLGKTALLAGALDERIALTVANQAGCGGSGPSRHDDPQAETVTRINKHFPHWFCENFKAFGDDTSRLPFDQHSLVALCAPRPVLFTAAADDLWANPAGQFEVLAAASPVYELLGVKGLEADAMPQPNAPLVDSRLGYWIRAGRHSMSPPDWQTYMNFADKWLP